MHAHLTGAVPSTDASYPTIAPAGPANQPPAKDSQSLYPTVPNAAGAMAAPASQASVHACVHFMASVSGGHERDAECHLSVET